MNKSMNEPIDELTAKSINLFAGTHRQNKILKHQALHQILQPQRWVSWLQAQLPAETCQFCDSQITAESEFSIPQQVPGAMPPVCQQCFAGLPWCHEPGSALGECSAFYYLEPIRQYILSGKGRKQLDKLGLLAKLTAIQLTHQVITPLTPLPQAIVPVPLHYSRLRKRGFNQSIELIRPFTQQHNVPLLTQHVYRSHQVSEQKGLTESARKINTRHAFALRRPLNCEHVAIFDDVITTGATCSALKTLLIEHGVKKVEIWCCATTKQ